MSDITERISSEVTDRQRFLDAAHVARLRTMGEMASEISHELNQPLAAISIYSHACRRMIESGKKKPEDIVQSLNDISEQAERAGEVIKRIRTFASKKELQLIKLNINDLVKDAMKMIDLELRLHNIELVLNLANNLPNTLMDAVLIEQVILNLSRNAIEAMDKIDESKRILKIQTQANKSTELEINIEDNGPGLHTDQIKQIFEPFHTTKPDGMGLGLAISHTIVDEHQGKLWAVPGPQGGTVFSFTLPLVFEE